MDINERIAQFERLAQDDPENDMVHFSLGGALNQAGRYEEAARSYRRATELNPGMSKAYQLAGAAYMAAQDIDSAVAILTEGYKVATERGDMMPRRGIEDLLKQLGAPIPEVEDRAPSPAVHHGGFVDKVTGKPGTQMPRPPMRGPIGQWLYENVSNEHFQEWIGLGTKIINELRLDLSDDAHADAYDYGMRHYLGITDELYRSLTGKEPPQPPRDYKDVLDQILQRSGHLEEFKGEMYRGVGR